MTVAPVKLIDEVTVTTPRTEFVPVAFSQFRFETVSVVPVAAVKVRPPLKLLTCDQLLILVVEAPAPTQPEQELTTRLVMLALVIVELATVVVLNVDVPVTARVPESVKFRRAWVVETVRAPPFI